MKRRPPAVPLALALSLSVAACGPDALDRQAAAEADEAAVAATLDSLYGVFSAAYRQGSSAMLMDRVYADNGYYLPPGSPILEGKPQFREQFTFLDRLEEGQGPSIEFDIIDRDVSGDLAYDIGYYTLRPHDAPPDAGGGRGKFIVIWKRNGAGEWRIHADGYSAVRQVGA